MGVLEMETKKKFKIFAIISLFLLATLISTASFSIPILDNLTRGDNNSLQGTTALGGSRRIEIVKDIALPEAPQTVPYYKVLDEDHEEEIDPELMTTQQNIPSEEEAMSIAEAYLQSHGGLPNDAILKDVQSQFVKKVTNGEVVESMPLMTEVTYGRIINGMPVVGPGDTILVAIGENGKILCFLKTWRTLEEAGQTEIIEAEHACDKLKNGETIETPLSSYRNPIKINKMYLAYYSKVTGEEQTFYKPVWVFEGIEKRGGDVLMVVEASIRP